MQVLYRRAPNSIFNLVEMKCVWRRNRFWSHASETVKRYQQAH